VRGGAGPFVAGSTLSDLIGLAEGQGLGLRIVDKDERVQGHYRQGCDGLCAAAREFCCDIDESMSPCSRRCLPVMAELKLAFRKPSGGTVACDKAVPEDPERSRTF
jgi:hypothetical protein